MRPTARLRFIEREMDMHPFNKTVDHNGKIVPGKILVRVLQQWFEREPGTPYGPDGEWRDVPMEGDMK